MAVLASNVTCPHCQAANPAGAQFCEACGMALPTVAAGGPRVVDAKGFATTAAGQAMQGEELRKQMKKASGALLAVAIIQSVVVAILIAVVANVRGGASVDRILRNPALIGMIASAVIFWGLFVWARFQPLPAAIVGLVLYATLVAINVATSVSQMSSNPSGPRTGFGGIGIGWLDIVILAVLGQAISAGLKYRRMSETTV